MAKEVYEEAEIITLEFDDGSTMECEEMGVFDFEGRDYIALIPHDDSDDVYIYGYDEDSDDCPYLDITDQELFRRVAMEFQAIMDAED